MKKQIDLILIGAVILLVTAVMVLILKITGDYRQYDAEIVASVMGGVVFMVVGAVLAAIRKMANYRLPRRRAITGIVEPTSVDPNDPGSLELD